MTFLRNKRNENSYDLHSKKNDNNQSFLDMAEVINDSSLITINPVTKAMVDDFMDNPDRYKFQRELVTKYLQGSMNYNRIVRENNEVLKEINENNINEITEKWAIESLEKNPKSVIQIVKEEEKRDYISKSLASANSDPDFEIRSALRKKRKKFIIQIVGFPAAALIATFILIKIFSPTGNPEKVYAQYYKPFNAISSVTRTIAGNADTLYDYGIGLYKDGKYKSAARVFEQVTDKDSSFYTPKFFEGITQLELGGFNQAKQLLSEVINHSFEFRKEAYWYLGLTYLKTGEREKAISTFSYLADSEGFYRDRARKVLRNLK